jgi:hypothetical protein
MNDSLSSIILAPRSISAKIREKYENKSRKALNVLMGLELFDRIQHSEKAHLDDFRRTHAPDPPSIPGASRGNSACASIHREAVGG